MHSARADGGFYKTPGADPPPGRHACGTYEPCGCMHACKRFAIRTYPLHIPQPFVFPGQEAVAGVGQGLGGAVDTGRDARGEVRALEGAHGGRGSVTEEGGGGVGGRAAVLREQRGQRVERVVLERTPLQPHLRQRCTAKHPGL